MKNAEIKKKLIPQEKLERFHALLDTKEAAIDGLLDHADAQRALILKFIGSLTLADHMGDVWGDISAVLDLLGIDTREEDFDELSDIGTFLGKKYGVTTLHDTELGDE